MGLLVVALNLYWLLWMWGELWYNYTYRANEILYMYMYSYWILYVGIGIAVTGIFAGVQVARKKSTIGVGISIGFTTQIIHLALILFG